tara:strand:- start:44 stop:607 length:564 start_codon:yes stop_codon:yes gene_type:complete
MVFLKTGTVVCIIVGSKDSVIKWTDGFIPNKEAKQICITKCSNIKKHWKFNGLIETEIINHKCLTKDDILIGGREKSLLNNKNISKTLPDNDWIVNIVEEPVTFFDKRKNSWVIYKNKNITFPGGKRDNFNETPYDTIRRELYEETGIYDDNLTCICGNKNCYGKNRCVSWKSKNNVPIWIFISRLN